MLATEEDCERQRGKPSTVEQASDRLRNLSPIIDRHLCAESPCGNGELDECGPGPPSDGVRNWVDLRVHGRAQSTERQCMMNLFQRHELIPHRESGEGYSALPNNLDIYIYSMGSWSSPLCNISQFRLPEPDFCL